MLTHPSLSRIEYWPILRLVEYARNPRKNDAAVDRMCASIAEFGFKIPVLARSTGEVVDGHLRLKAARKLGITEIPVILCDEWSDAQVKAFRLLVNRSVTWADWDESLLALEMQDLQATGFDAREIDDLLIIADEEHEDAAPPLPAVAVSRAGDLWLCGDATSAEAVALLLGGRKPRLMVSDPPYGISLDSEWRDRAGLNPHGAAEPSYLKKRTPGHTETTISGDTRADWSETFALVPSLEVLYVWYASSKTVDVLTGIERIGFWSICHTTFSPSRSPDAQLARLITTRSLRTLSEDRAIGVVNRIETLLWTRQNALRCHRFPPAMAGLLPAGLFRGDTLAACIIRTAAERNSST